MISTRRYQTIWLSAGFVRLDQVDMFHSCNRLWPSGPFGLVGNHLRTKRPLLLAAKLGGSLIPHPLYPKW